MQERAGDGVCVGAGHPAPVPKPDVERCEGQELDVRQVPGKGSPRAPMGEEVSDVEGVPVSVPLVLREKFGAGFDDEVGEGRAVFGNSTVVHEGGGEDRGGGGRSSARKQA